MSPTHTGLLLCPRNCILPRTCLAAACRALTDATRSFCTSIFLRSISNACFLGPAVSLSCGEKRWPTMGGEDDGRVNARGKRGLRAWEGRSVPRPSVLARHHAIAACR